MYRYDPGFNKNVGFNTYREIQKVEELANKLGFKFTYPKHHGADADYFSLVPIDNDALPIYSRDAQLFTGTLGDVDAWLRGLQWARDYDTMLKVSDSKKRERKEQDARNRRLVEILKHEQNKEETK
jgi:hypothetical protein